MTKEQFDRITKEGRDKAERYYRMFKACEYDANQDLKAYGYTDEEILKEFITLSYWYGYMDGQIIDEVSEIKNPTKWKRFKKWLYDICDTLGIAGSFGGF